MPTDTIPLSQAIKDEDLIGRLYKNSIVTESGCWESTYHRNRIGWLNEDGERVSITTSRLSLAYELGRDLLDGYYTCHTCDNPSCIRPAHLWEGTTKENMRDAVDKDRATIFTHYQIFWLRKKSGEKDWYGPSYRYHPCKVLGEWFFEYFGITISKPAVRRVIRNEHRVDLSWYPDNRTYLKQPLGWKESWGQWQPL